MSWGGFASNGGFDNGVNTGRRLARKYGTKPKRSVFPTDQVIHVWAQQSQAYGRNAKASVYFEQETLFSYGAHYVMARFAKPDVVLFNAEKSSPTTEGHKSTAFYAVRQHKTFYVVNPSARTPAEHDANLAAIVAAAKACADAMQNARLSLWRRNNAAQNAVSLVNIANDYQKEFFPRRRKPAIVTPDSSLVAACRFDAQLKDARRKYLAESRNFESALHDRGARAYGVFRTVKTFAAAAAAYRRLQVKAGEKPISVDVVRLIKLRKAARVSMDRLGLDKWGRTRDSVYSPRHSASNAAALSFAIARRRILTAQGNYSYENNPTKRKSYSPTDYSCPRGFARFDSFAAGMLTTAQLDKIERDRLEWQAQWAAEREERARKEAEAKAERAKREANAVAEWRNGRPVPTIRYHELPCMLRVAGSEVLTSWGARFPVSDAVAAWPLLRAVFARGKAWKRNGERIELGHFQIDRVASDGMVTAGCHTLSRAEIEHCAALLGLEV